MAIRWNVAMAILGGCMLASTAMAAEGDPPGCLHSGQRHALGEIVCIETCPGPARLARCEMFLNNTTWTYVSDACPSAGIIEPNVIDRVTHWLPLSPVPRESIETNSVGLLIAQRAPWNTGLLSCAG